jgi:hypothetical protein
MTRSHRLSASVPLLAALLLPGCFYDTSGEAADVDAGDTETGADTDTDADTDADAGVEGMGDACTQTGGECDGFPEADFCLYNPIDPTQGVCTTTGCIADGCPATYTCCDCTGASYFFVDLCASADYASQLPMAGCTCE